MLQMTQPSMTMPLEEEKLPSALTAQLLLRRTGNWSRWISRHWGEIAVEDAVYALESIAGRSRLHAQVCVTLGHVLPADIRVELVPAGPLPEGHPLAHGRAMFSVAVLQNGRYWFAVNTSADPADADRSWMVRILPARPAVTGEVQPVARTLDAVPAGTSRDSLMQRRYTA